MIDGLIAERIERTERLLAEAARDLDMVISGDGRVSEADAAKLLGYAPRYLKQMRIEGRSPIAYRCGMAGARVSYRIEDLGRWIEERRDTGAAEANDS